MENMKNSLNNSVTNNSISSNNATSNNANRNNIIRNSIIRNSIYQGKNMCRDKSFLFWNLLYPLILATFFYIAFNGMLNIEIKNINVGITSESPIESILENIDFVKIHKISDYDYDNEIKEKLQSGEIHGFIDNNLNIQVKGSGINQTIIKEIVEQIKQMQKLNKPIENYDFTIDYTENRNQKANSIIITFYALIAMVSTYGIFSGMETVSFIQANLTNVGTRINITPLKKHNFLIAGMIASLFLNLVPNGLLLIFVKYILKINLFTEMKYSIIFIILGNLFGVALGIFIGVSNKKSIGIKSMIGIIATLVLSFLSGMMGPDIKLVVDKYVPTLGKINPISIITNNLYRINLLGNTKNVGEGMIILLLYSIALMFVSYIFLRRRNYDSL